MNNHTWKIIRYLFLNLNHCHIPLVIVVRDVLNGNYQFLRFNRNNDTRDMSVYNVRAEKRRNTDDFFRSTLDFLFLIANSRRTA